MDSFVDNLKQQVQCLLCKETMTEPKVLQCFHTYCKSCLKKLVQLGQQENILECPRCNSLVKLQDLNDVEDFQTSTVHSRILKVLEFVENQKICSVSSSHPEALWQCLDCDRLICEECLKSHSEFIKNHTVLSLSDLKKEDIDKMLTKESPCEIHDNQDVEFHCQDCDMLMCVICQKDHSSHKTTPVQEFIAIKKDFMFKNLKEIDELNTDEKEKKRQEEIALMIQRAGIKAQEEIEKTTKTLIQALLNHKKQLLNQVKKSITKAERNLRIIHHTKQAHAFISNLGEVATASDLVAKQELNSSQKFIYDPYAQDTTGFIFVENQKLCEQVKDGLGLVRPLKTADPGMSSMKIDSSNKEVDTQARLTIKLKTKEGEVPDETVDSVAIHFTPDDAIVKEIQMQDDGEIAVDFIPRYFGQLTVDVLLKSHHISNSPQAMFVKPREIKQITVDSKLNKGLNTGSQDFTGIAVNKTNSRIAVADCKLRCVRVYNMEGDLLLTYTGTAQGWLGCPDGLAFLNETDLVIADCVYHRTFSIYIVNTSTGKLVRTFDCCTNQNYGQYFIKSCGVHVHNEANIFVCDHNNGRVKVFTKNGDCLHQFIVPGRPYSIVTHNGLFYVSMGTYNSVVHVIDMKDNPPTTITTIGDEDYADGQSHNPGGLAIDNDNNLLICDISAQVIHKFTLDGRYIGLSGQLTGIPRHIAVLRGGLVICTTSGEGCFFFNTNT